MRKLVDKMRKSIYFNIPNLMGYLRLVLIPVFLILYTRAETQGDYWVSFCVLAISFLTDFFDGMIARKLDMVTDFGKALDPVADKLTQGALAIAILSRYPTMLYFLILFIIKEIYMVAMGLYLIKKGKGVNGAQWYGKVCTAVVDICSLVLLIFTDMPYFAGCIMIAVMIGVVILALVGYIRFHISILKERELVHS